MALPDSLNLGGQQYELTLTATGMTGWTPRKLRAGETTVVQIHEQAAAAGWRLAGAVQAPFSPGIPVLPLARTGERSGHWT